MGTCLSPGAFGAPGLPRQEWFCLLCGDSHEDRDTALACCDSFAVDDVAYRYACPICGAPCDDQTDAIACCEWDRTPEGARAIKRALEEAGQMTLWI